MYTNLGPVPSQRPRDLFLLEATPIDQFDALGLIVTELRKLPLASPPRQPALILVKKPDQEVDGAFGHVEQVFNILPECVVASQETSLGGQVGLDGMLDALKRSVGSHCTQGSSLAE